ncbi:MAG: HAMP domain-containing protein, partial [Candidatus Brocadiales bacterium]
MPQKTLKKKRWSNPFQTIKAKLLIFGLCISLIPIAILTGIYYFNTQKTIRKETKGWLTAVAESRRIHVVSFMEGKKGRVIDFSSDGFIRDGLDTINRSEEPFREETVNGLNKHLSLNKQPLDHDIDAIAVLDMNGRVVASTIESWIGQDMSDQEVFTQAISSNYNMAYVAQPRYNPYLNENSIFISAPLTTRRGTDTIGVLITAYGLSALNHITANRAGMGETGEIVLGQRDGDDIVFLNSLRYAPDAAPLSLSVPVGSTEAETMRLALEGGNGAIIALDYRNVPVVAAYQDIPSLGWGLVAKIDKAEAFAPLRILGLVALIVGLVAAAAVSGVAVVYATAASRPLKRLKDAADKFSAGDLDYRVKVTNKDEVGDLATSFNAMAGELSSEIAAHERATEALSKEGERLKAMSGELAAANKELEAFCYSVSHDLRAPLRGIDGFSKALVEDYADKLDDTGKDYIARVRAASQRMALLIDDLLALSRITRGGIHHVTVDLSKLTRGVADELQKAEPGRNVEFVV